jgi:MFS family permease
MRDSVDSPTTLAAAPASLSDSGRMLMLTAAFLGWLFAGFHLSITSVVMLPASVDLLGRVGELNPAAYDALKKQSKAKPEEGVSPLTEAEREQLSAWDIIVGRWVAWLKTAFLFGAATGGLCFGALGDRFGRTKGMGLAILTYSAMAGAAYFAQRPEHLLVCWFFACMGVGGMWPNGVALVTEAWASLSRMMSAGLIGAAANIGIYLMSTVMRYHPPVPSELGQSVPDTLQSLWNFSSVVPADWRWAMLVAATPFVLGLFSLVAVPESPLWLAQKRDAASSHRPSSRRITTGEIFVPPLLWITLVGIALATIPIVGGWGSADWMVQWADRAGDANPSLKADVSRARAITGIVGSFLGGWIASAVGRRMTYFLVSLIELGIAQYTFWFVVPTDPDFLWWVSALGLFSGVYFGWLPFCLPELFPTRARSAGAGVSFNFGRVLTALTVFATGALMSVFDGKYDRIGRVTSLIFAFGMIVIWFAPDTTKKRLDE